MFDGNIKIGNREIPRILLGTSPFIGAGQFGHRARLYYLDLYKHPENILKIIKKSYELGISGVQVIPYEPVVETVRWAISDGLKLNIIGTIRPDNIGEDIELFAELEADAMLLHANITDTLDWDIIKENLRAIKEKKVLAGMATHRPFHTTEKLLESSIMDLFDVYMFPVNKLGYIMDTDSFGQLQRVKIREMLKKLDKKLIAKKILAAGVLKPEEAFDFLASLDYVDMVTVGIASEAEAMETFRLLAKK